MCDTKLESVNMKTCTTCLIEKVESDFKLVNGYFKRNCKLCILSKRREHYKNNESHRQKCIDNAVAYKKKRKEKRDEQLQMEQEALGIDNKACRYCFEIRHKDRFRHNRLKCRDCERDEPIEKFKRYVRTRIYNCLKRHKAKSSIEYLGTSTNGYLDWIMNYNSKYNLYNYGPIWHIDHVIPLSHFDMSNEKHQLLAFNWRNTMPLSATENLKKNNRIDTIQVKNHYKKIIEYHTHTKMNIPEDFKKLYATYLDAGTSLEPTTTTP